MFTLIKLKVGIGFDWAGNSIFDDNTFSFIAVEPCSIGRKGEKISQRFVHHQISPSKLFSVDDCTIKNYNWHFKFFLSFNEKNCENVKQTCIAIIMSLALHAVGYCC